MSGWFHWVFWGAATIWFAMTVYVSWHLRWAGRLPSLEELERSPPATPPGNAFSRVSVVLPVRDESARIEGTVRRVLAQAGVELEVIAVDDRSRDGTSEILRRLADEDARLRVVRVEALPERWLGKCHACHVGAASATGDWILFIDADSWLKPDALRRALCVAERAGASHLTLAPGVVAASVGGKAWHLAFPLVVVNMMSAVNRDRPRAFVGIGAFNLVRGAAYRACGGYEALRLTVLDDMKLGLLLRRAGQRTRAYFAGDDVECRWGATLWGVVRLLEKNYFAAVDYRLWLAVPGVVGGMFAWALAVLGPFTGTAAGLAGGAGLMSLCLPAAIQARRLGWSPMLAPLAPMVFPFMFYAMANSTIVTLRNRGIRWRDTFYPLDVLRRGNVR